MASHCHCHHQQQNLYHPPPYHSCCCSSPPPHPYHSQNTTTTAVTDPLLVQAIASQLLLHQSSSQSHIFSHHLNQPQQQQQQQQPHHQKQPHHQQQQTQTQAALITSLIHRIDALESSLQHLSSSPSPPPPLSLRDLAARTIQTHFRAFLVRRSRALRYLKHLAIIKSNFNLLKSSLSEKTHFNYQSLSHKATDLLLKLDLIQGGDPMIRDGKKSVSREIVGFLEFVDGVLAKRQQIYTTKPKKKKKNVRFADEISNSSRVYAETQEEIDYGRVYTDDDQQELIKNLCRRVKQIEGLARVSEEEEDEDEEETERDVEVRKNVKKGNGNCENGSHFQEGQQSGNKFVFSAPLPVHMEPRKD